MLSLKTDNNNNNNNYDDDDSNEDVITWQAHHHKWSTSWNEEGNAHVESRRMKREGEGVN